MTRAKRAGEGGSAAWARTLPSLSVPAWLYCKQGPQRGKTKALLGSGCFELHGRLFRVSAAPVPSFFVREGGGGTGGGSVTDGLWVTTAFVDGGVCLNGGRAASLPAWPPEDGVGGGMGVRRGTGGFDYGPVKGL